MSFARGKNRGRWAFTFSPRCCWGWTVTHRGGTSDEQEKPSHAATKFIVSSTTRLLPATKRTSPCPLSLQRLNTETTESLSDLCVLSCLGRREHGEENLPGATRSRQLARRPGRAH